MNARDKYQRAKLSLMDFLAARFAGERWIAAMFFAHPSQLGAEPR
jgi:hypothetical protein